LRVTLFISGDTNKVFLLLPHPYIPTLFTCSVCPQTCRSFFGLLTIFSIVFPQHKSLSIILSRTS
jgi:hypothetical protein